MIFKPRACILLSPMNVRKLFSCLCLLSALFSMGSLRKNEDPIAATTQTGPISLKQKNEETKGGVKGAPSPSMTFYRDQKILTNSPIKENNQEEIVEESRTAEEPAEEAVEEDDSWEVDTDTESKKDQGSEGKAVEKEDSWWSEDDSEPPPPDSQSG